MYRIVAFFWFTVCLLVPFHALAQVVTEPTQKWWQALLLYIVTVVGGIAAPIISYLLVVLLKKKSIAVDAALLDSIVEKGVNFAEEQATKALKGGAKPDSGAEKMKLAISVVDSLIEQFRLKKLAVDKTKLLIEAKLGGSRGTSTTPASAPPQ